MGNFSLLLLARAFDLSLENRLIARMLRLARKFVGGNQGLRERRRGQKSRVNPPALEARCPTRCAISRRARVLPAPALSVLRSLPFPRPPRHHGTVRLPPTCGPRPPVHLLFPIHRPKAARTLPSPFSRVRPRSAQRVPRQRPRRMVMFLCFYARLLQVCGLFKDRGHFFSCPR